MGGSGVTGVKSSFLSADLSADGVGEGVALQTFSLSICRSRSSVLRVGITVPVDPSLLLVLFSPFTVAFVSPAVSVLVSDFSVSSPS